MNHLKTIRSEPLFIGGRWHPSTSESWINVTDPSTEELLGRVADATIKDARHAVDAAANAADGWAATPARRRSEILHRCFELMVRDREQIAELISRENGKALSDARGEAAYAAEFFAGLPKKLFASTATSVDRRVVRRERLSSTSRSESHYL